jgi:hypothetical protein
MEETTTKKEKEVVPRAEIKLTLSPEVVKFLNVHLTKTKDRLNISCNKPLGRKILNLVRKAPNGYKQPEEYNCIFFVTLTDHIYRRYPIDPRSHDIYIPGEGIKYLEVTFSRFIRKYYCMWYHRQKIEKPDLTEQQLMTEFRSLYGMTEEELTNESLHVSYWRFKKDFGDPEKFLFKILDTLYVNVQYHL